MKAIQTNYFWVKNLIIINKYIKSNYGHNEISKYLRLKKMLRMIQVCVK